MVCPICGAERPEEMHLDWCTYDGPEPEEDDAYRPGDHGWDWQDDPSGYDTEEEKRYA